MTDVLIAEHVLEYPGGYTRSVGPVIGRFLTSLREGRIEGVRVGDGRVVVPPTEYDPVTSNPVGESDSDWVEVGPGGVVSSWTWVEHPRPGKHPLQRPFAFALIRPDRADTAMLHVVDAGSADVMSVGMRVAPRWREARVGNITDIEAWVPLVDGEEPRSAPPNASDAEAEPVTGIVSPVRLEYKRSAGVATTRYLRGLAEHKILGGHASGSTDVYAASRGTDPKTGEPTSVEVEVQDRGTITTFCVVNIPGLSELAPEVPYVSAQILLDGADNTFFGLIRGIDVDEVRMGMRVHAVWADELVADHTSIKWWEPTGEADAAYESYKGYL